MSLLKYYQKLDDAVAYLLSSAISEKKLLKQFFKHKEITFVDIGTNVGNYLNFVQKNFKIKKAYCFEPITELCDSLQKKYGNNIKIFNCALSNNKKKRKFYIYEIPSQSSFYKQKETYSSIQKVKKTINIKTDFFDRIFNSNLKIDFCKIDAQGEDFQILKGMSKNLKRGNIKLLKVEICFPGMHKNVVNSYLDILNYLNKFNYQLFSISKIKYKNNSILFLDAFFKKN